jgi:hypothetical protein
MCDVIAMPILALFSVQFLCEMRHLQKSKYIDDETVE